MSLLYCVVSLGVRREKAGGPFGRHRTCRIWRSARRRLAPIIPTSRFSSNNLAALYFKQGRYVLNF